MKKTHRVLVVMLVAALLGATVPSLVGHATAGPLTGTITVEMHESYAAPGVTSSTSCSYTLALAGDGATSARGTYTHDEQRTEQLGENVTRITTVHVEPSQGGSFSNVPAPGIGIDPSRGTYTVSYQLPELPLKKTTTTQTTGEQPRVDVNFVSASPCPDAIAGFVDAYPAGHVYLTGKLPGGAQLHGTVQAHGDFDHSGGNGSATVSWSLTDPTLGPPAGPTPVRDNGQNDALTPPGTVLTGTITVEMHEAHSAPDRTSSTACSATLALAGDGATSARGTYTHDEQRTEQLGENVTRITTVHVEPSQGGSFSNVPAPGIGIDPSRGTYTVSYQLPELPLKKTTTTQTTGEQPRVDVNFVSAAPCPDAIAGFVDAYPAGHVYLTGKLPGGAQLHGTVQAHGDFDHSGGNGSATVTWSLTDPTLVPPPTATGNAPAACTGQSVQAGGTTPGGAPSRLAASQAASAAHDTTGPFARNEPAGSSAPSGTETTFYGFYGGGSYLGAQGTVSLGLARDPTGRVSLVLGSQNGLTWPSGGDLLKTIKGELKPPEGQSLVSLVGGLEYATTDAPTLADWLGGEYQNKESGHLAGPLVRFPYPVPCPGLNFKFKWAPIYIPFESVTTFHGRNRYNRGVTGNIRRWGIGPGIPRGGVHYQGIPSNPEKFGQ